MLPSPQVFIIVDTDKLASQMSDNLSNIGFERSVVAGSIEHLQDLIREGKSQLVLTTIQKFEDIEPQSAGNENIVVLSDEAHRFMEKDLGSRLDASMPHAFHFGFTGTPSQCIQIKFLHGVAGHLPTMHLKRRIHLEGVVEIEVDLIRVCKGCDHRHAVFFCEASHS